MRYIKTIKQRLGVIFWAVRFFFLNKENKKRLGNQNNGTALMPVKYCSIWQDKTMIKDIIEMNINPKEDTNRAASGALSLDEYERRTWQICGITSFQMYLETKKIPYNGGNISLLYESLLYGTYKYDPQHNGPTDFHISPMYHQAFLTYIQDRYSIRGQSMVGIDLIGAVKQLSEGKFVLLSLNQNIRDNEVKEKYCDYTGRHIVVLTGYTIHDKQLTSIFIHNSSGFSQNNSQENFELPIDIAKKVFARKALILA